MSPRRKRRPGYTDVTWVFMPGRFDADPAEVARYARALIDTHQAQALVTTETYNSRFAIAIRESLPTGWRARRIGEYLVAWDRKVLKQSRTQAVLRRLSRVYRDRQTWRDAHVATKHLIVRKTGALIAPDVGHLPSGVEMGTHWKPGPQATAHRAATAAWGRLNRDRLRRYPATTLVAFMDCNLNQREPAWRAHMTRELGMRSIWEGRVPNRGTYGHRLIDTAHTNARVLAADVSRVPRPAGLDHTAIWTTTRIPTPPAKKKVTR